MSKKKKTKISVGNKAQTKLFYAALKEDKFLKECSKVDISKLNRLYTI